MVRAVPTSAPTNTSVSSSQGSLVARIVFQPLEEMSRVFFSKVLATTGPGRQSLKQASSALLSILAVQSSLTVIFIVFAPAYSPIALQALLPRRYMSTSAPDVLAAWIWYIPFLAVNGVLEAFLSSTATPKELLRQSRCVSPHSYPAMHVFMRLRQLDGSLLHELYLHSPLDVLAPNW
jgi:oligosaccharide translocation protein RFT1